MGNRILLLPVIGATTFFLLLAFYTKFIGPIPLSFSSKEAFAVSGTGKAFAPPDMANVEVGIYANGDTVKQVKDQVDTAAVRIVNALKALGIEKSDIKTIRYDISPTYDFQAGRQIISRYSANTSLSIKVKNIDAINSAVETATANGANQVTGIKFDISNKAKLEKEAREMAVKEAKSKAEQAARAAGFSLGKILTYSENLEDKILPVPIGLSVSQGEEVPAVPSIEAGSKEIKITVSLSYEIR